MISSISSLVGRDEIAPFFCTHNAPEIFPYSIAFRRIGSVISSGLVTPCRRRLERNPPQNASPAPVASTAFTVRPPTVKMLFPKNTCAPLEPKVRITAVRFFLHRRPYPPLPRRSSGYPQNPEFHPMLLHSLPCHLSTSGFDS